MSETTDTAVARDRHGLEVLPYEVCQQRLREHRVGRIALVSGGTPTIFPVTYAVAGSSVVFRSPVGAKLDAAERAQPIAFEIDDHDLDARTGWSVVVTGVADTVDDPEIVAGLDALGLDSWALDHVEDVTWVRVRAESVTGRATRTADGTDD
jgi:hypothetical protein